MGEATAALEVDNQENVNVLGVAAAHVKTPAVIFPNTTMLSAGKPVFIEQSPKIWMLDPAALELRLDTSGTNALIQKVTEVSGNCL